MVKYFLIVVVVALIVTLNNINMRKLMVIWREKYSIETVQRVILYHGIHEMDRIRPLRKNGLQAEKNFH